MVLAAGGAKFGALVKSSELPMAESTGFADRDHEERLDFTVVQKLDFSDRDKVDYCIRYLSENVEFLRRRNEALRRAIAGAESAAPSAAEPVVPDYWHKYKRYRRLCREIADVEARISGA